MDFCIVIMRVLNNYVERSNFLGNYSLKAKYKHVSTLDVK